MNALTVTAPTTVTRFLTKGDLVAVETEEFGLVMFKITHRVRNASRVFTGRAANWSDSVEQEVAFIVDQS